MSPDASLAVQGAVFALLAADSGLGALIGPRLHDRRPEGAGFPHVVIGEASCLPDDSCTRAGQVHVLTLHAWSRYRGRAEAKRILAAMTAALHRQVPVLGGAHACVQARVTYGAVLDDGDGVTTHGVLRLRVVTEAITPHTT
ncbi:DUF3168 domain-containing protein [Zavarzinia compransoris]|uniref:DUF3168 domain-containing protein n=1 Tax=Zavarzinia compransoris TaxID=1264899 RepID=A0A317DWQ1_9PROT|nr:DUF3168 domain-containing protein [Zavarzinia compransoris]PWR19148.1 DUF3168 domain-containing protein [Zavarzinia compransoris]TDP49162.1 uncharacterized protein DUF3168 [Zavarzinia compransoris]